MFIPDRPAVRAQGGRITGTKLPIIDGSLASIAVVLACGDDGLLLGLVELDAAGVHRFQAIKHKLADTLVTNTLARSHAFNGLWAVDAAAAAPLSAGEAYWVAARQNIQVHGAMGFTWDADPHLHYRRAHHLSLVLGGPAVWQARLFDRVRHRHRKSLRQDRLNPSEVLAYAV